MKKCIPWLTTVVVLVIIFGTIYTVTQQAERTDANYPQIQIAEDAAMALDHGDKPTTLVGDKTNLDASLAPFIIIYDQSGKVVTGSGYLHNTIPVIPFGVLSAANGVPYHSVTWQPQPGIRIAAISVKANNYYIVSGRSLTETEKNENMAFRPVALGGLACLIVVALAFSISQKKS
jgi:hypothetical protein